MSHFDTQPATIDQLPKTAAEYYRTSTMDNGVYKYTLLPKRDCCGRKVYLKTFDGDIVGERSLLSYQDYKRKVLEWAQYKGLSMGLSRWTTTVYAD